MRIVFMGTPEFAVPSLRILVENGCEIVGVITAPDRPKGRGKKLGMSAVKEYALEAGLKIMQPTNLKNLEFQDELRSLKADLQIVVAFRMLPEAVWNMPPIGTFNLHASLLPQYRGAAPINWAIINGEGETGITTFFLKHQIDTGKIIFQEREPINDDDDVGTLYERLMTKGAQLVLKTVRAIDQGEFPQIDQNESQALKSAPKIFREDCEIDWNNTSDNIRNHVRGLSPYPAAWTQWKGKNLKVYEVRKVPTPLGNHQSGEIWSNDNMLFAATADGTLSLEDLQLEGKKRMKAGDLLRGLKQV